MINFHDIWIIFAVSILSLYTKICDRMLHPFYRDTSKSWLFILRCRWVYLTLLNKDEFNYGFLTMAYSFEICDRDSSTFFLICSKFVLVFEKTSKRFFSIIFTNIFSLIFLQAILLFHDIFWTNESPFHLGTIVNCGHATI